MSLSPPIIDLHEDISLYYFLGGYGLKFKAEDFGVDLPGRHGDIPKFRRANAKIIFSSIAHIIPSLNAYRLGQQTSGYGVKVGAMRIRSPTLITLEHIKTYYNLLASYRDALALMSRRSDVENVFKDDRTFFLIAIEGSEPLEDIEDMDLFYMLGVRSLQITWNFDNKFAASCMSKRDYGLTGDGEELVKRCNELGVIIDLAHASRRTTLDALSASKLPAIVSHANIASVHKHVRNLDDEELEALSRNGGVVGITLIEPTIGKVADVKSLADHVQYVYQRFGSENLAIGTDFFGIMHVEEPRGLEDITKFGNLWAELINRGLSEGDVEKIAFRNALRVIEANASRWVEKPF